MQGIRYRVCASSLSLVLLSYAVCVCVRAYQLLFMDCASFFVYGQRVTAVCDLLSCNNFCALFAQVMQTFQQVIIHIYALYVHTISMHIKHNAESYNCMI